MSTVNALQTPMINASMVTCLPLQNNEFISHNFSINYQFFFLLSQKVLCDRHFGGINYPIGGVGGIAKALANGLVDKGSNILYKANVTSILLNNGKAVSDYL